MPKMPKRRMIIIAMAVVFVVALPCTYIGMNIWRGIALWRAWGPTASVYTKYGDLSENYSVQLSKYGKEYCVKVVPCFKDGARDVLIIPHDATDILIAREQWIDAGSWVAFTVPRESLSSVLKKITGHDLSEFKDGMSRDKYSKPPKGPRGKDRLKAAPYWNIDGVKNGKHLEEEESDYCAVDVDACRVFLKISG